MATENESALLGLSLQQLTAIMEEFGQPGYRGRQLFEAIYQGRAAAVEQISTFSLELRQCLSERGYVLGLPRIAKKFGSSDGTVRYLLGLVDGQTVETVW